MRPDLMFSKKDSSCSEDNRLGWGAKKEEKLDGCWNSTDEREQWPGPVWSQRTLGSRHTLEGRQKAHADPVDEAGRSGVRNDCRFWPEHLDGKKSVTNIIVSGDVLKAFPCDGGPNKHAHCYHF